MTNLIAGFIVIVGTILIGCVLALLLGFPFMWLWNWLMPELFGLKTISFWQSVGLLLLSHFIFQSSSSSNSKED